MLGNDITKVFYLGYALSIFLCRNGEMVLIEASENFQNEAVVFLEVLGVNKDVVYINDYPYIQYIGKNGLDYSLEDNGSVDHTEVYNYKLEEAIVIAKSRLPLVAFLDPDKIKATLKVDLNKVFSTSKPILELRYQR